MRLVRHAAIFAFFAGFTHCAASGTRGFVLDVSASFTNALAFFALALLLVVTAVQLARTYRPRRREAPPGVRERVLAARPNLAQLAVRVDAWPPAGELMPLAVAARGVPDAGWPDNLPLRLSGEVVVRAGEAGVGVWWLLGERLGGEGRGLRDMAPRFEPGPGGSYWASRRPFSWEALDPVVAETISSPGGLPWSSCCLWVGCLAATVMTQHPMLFMAVPMSFLAAGLMRYGHE